MVDGENVQADRDASGRFITGNKANADGVNGHSKGWTPISIRLRKWLDLPIIDVMAYLGNENAINALPMIDAMCIRIIEKMMLPKASLKEMIKVFSEFRDTVDGKPTQTIVVNNPRPPMPDNIREMTTEQVAIAFKDGLFTP